jgi:hypothetical protein
MEDNQAFNGVRPKEGQDLAGEVSGNTGLVGGSKGSMQDGVWKHPNGATIIVTSDPLLGDGQARAATRAGFEYYRPVEDGEIKELGVPSENYAVQPERQVQSQADELASLRARLAALEAGEDRRRNEQTAGTPVPGTEPVVGSEETKQAAADKNETQTGVAVDPTTGDVRTEETEEEDVSFAQLQAEAKALGVNAQGPKEELKQRVAEAKAEKENK